MGRYRKELGHLASRGDQAGPYLLAARESRKLAQGQRKKDSSRGVNQTSSDPQLDRIVYPDDIVALDESLEVAVKHLLRALLPGGCLIFAGLSTEERAVVHAVAHRLGLPKKSQLEQTKAGENTGARIVRVEGATPPPACEAGQSPASPTDSVAALGNKHTVMKKHRWRRDTEFGGQVIDASEANIEGSSLANRKPSLQRSSEASRKSSRWSSRNSVKAPHSDAESMAQLQCSGSTISKGRTCIVWLRDDLRIHDNPALLRASQGGFSAALLVYIHDEANECSHPLKGAALYWKHESLCKFNKTLERMGTGLFLCRGDAISKLLAISEALGRSRCCLLFNRACEPWRHHRDTVVVKACEGAGLAVECFSANVLFEPWALQPIERWQEWRARVRAEEAAARGLGENAKARSGTPKRLEHVSGFGSYRFFHHALEELGHPPKPVPSVEKLPPAPKYLISASLKIEDLGYGRTAGRAFTHQFKQYNHRSRCSGHRKHEDLNEGCVGENEENQGDWASQIRTWWRFGEEAALERMQAFVEDVLAPGDFEGRKRLLASKRNTSELSPYIRFGELSARTVYWAAKQRTERTSQTLFQEDVRANDSKSNATFLRRFVWRDLAYWFLWEFPWLPETSLRSPYEHQVWTGTKTQLRHWQRGTTGFPLVDAAMRQLWAVGWMPNYLRHVVAQMLIEYLDITWKEGLAWFEWTLVDADVAINSFLWQNGGHCGPDQWEFVLHPVNAAKSCDPDGNYVRRWLPVLASLPTEYIHCPWEIPARLVGGRHVSYPERVLLDLDAARRAHAKRVIDVRRQHPEMISRTGHEWMPLPGRKGLLAKLVTRDEFRAETEDFIFFQTARPTAKHSLVSSRSLASDEALADSVREFAERSAVL